MQHKSLYVIIIIWSSTICFCFGVFTLCKTHENAHTHLPSFALLYLWWQFLNYRDGPVQKGPKIQVSFLVKYPI